MTKIKSIQSTIDCNPNMTSFERMVAFLTERGRLTQQSYFEALKREFTHLKTK